MEIIADINAAGLGLSISEIGQMLDWRGLNPLRVPEQADHHSHWIRAMDLHTEEKLRRNERGSILLTSNKGLGEWGELLGDTVIASAVLNRLPHHSHVPNIRGESYRLREKRSPAASVRITCSALPRRTPATTTQTDEVVVQLATDEVAGHYLRGSILAWRS